MDTLTTALVNALIAAAQADSTSVAATRAQQHDARVTLYAAQAALRLDAGLAQPAPRHVTVEQTPEGAESLFRLSDRVLGTPRRYRELIALNGMRGLALTAGATILVPTS